MTNPPKALVEAAIDQLSGIASPSAGVLRVEQAEALTLLIETARAAQPQHGGLVEASFQHRVQPWMMECFGAEIATDVLERNDRFIEEALGLVQANCYTADRAHALVDYVFRRPVGEPAQEVGGVMVTLAALCLAAGLDMHDAGEVELARITRPEIVEKIRAKQAAKPTGSALPIASNSPVVGEDCSHEAWGSNIHGESVCVDCGKYLGIKPTPTDTADHISDAPKMVAADRREAVAREIIARVVDRCRKLDDYANRRAWEKILSEEIQASLIAVPDGMVLVPREPTEEMLTEAVDNVGPIGCCNHTPDTARETWSAMIAARHR